MCLGDTLGLDGALNCSVVIQHCVSNELDLLALHLCLADIQLSDVSDAASGDIHGSYVLAEEQSDEYAQLICSVYTVYVCGGILFCKAFFLGILQNVIVGCAFLGHLSKNVVGSSINDSHYLQEVIAAELPADSCKHGDAASD